jgi:secondary thiamine-phosphate synthase enzyme
MASQPEPIERGREGHWAAVSDVVTFRTQAARQFIDLTDLVAERVRQSGIRHGLASVQTRHTTTAIVVNEDEPLLREDMDRLLERLVPSDIRYGHDDLARRTGVAPDERANGAAHCRSLLLGASETFHVIGGELQLGRWQRVFLVELDGPRARTVSILVMGIRHDHE